MNENDERQAIMPKYIRISLILLVTAILIALTMTAAGVIIQL